MLETSGLSSAPLRPTGPISAGRAAPPELLLETGTARELAITPGDTVWVSGQGKRSVPHDYRKYVKE